MPAKAAKPAKKIEDPKEKAMERIKLFIEGEAESLRHAIDAFQPKAEKHDNCPTCACAKRNINYDAQDAGFMLEDLRGMLDYMTTGGNDGGRGGRFRDMDYPEERY